MDTLFFSPPEIPFSMTPPMSVSRHFYSFIRPANYLTFSFLYFKGKLSFRAAANSKVYLTVKVYIKTSCCMTKLAKIPKVLRLYSKLLAYLFPPSCGLSLHDIIFKRVVFPAPLVPIIAVIYPALKIPLTPFKIYFFLYAFLKGIQSF